jgi:hypothetical protein
VHPNGGYHAIDVEAACCGLTLSWNPPPNGWGGGKKDFGLQVLMAKG